ncbi:MAG: hypothetical protein KAU62_02150 [Candidatus Heimdallarchaeota archaeon]|nr:hypothetical protein [Candidatus Heimdallarchaeota archaeon]MCK4609936.1 hypothetical protein [Candidatus Heimdallarchaeota archaeon]
MKEKKEIENPLPFIFSKEEWKVIHLRDYKNTSWDKPEFNQIAKELNKTESTVKNQYGSAKRKYNKFKEQIEQFQKFEESTLKTEDLKYIFRKHTWWD